MLIAVPIIGFVQLFMGVLLPLAKWPKWVAGVFLLAAVGFSITELRNPEAPISGSSHPEVVIAAMLAAFWSMPALLYVGGRLAGWAFLGHTPAWSYAIGRFVRRVVRGVLLGPSQVPWTREQ